MFRSKLGFRVVLTVVGSIFLIEVAFGLISLSFQKKSLLDKRLDSLKFSMGLLEVEIRKSIQHSRTQELSQIISDLARGYSAYSYVLFDAKGKTVIQEQVLDGYQPHSGDLAERLPLVADEKVSPVQEFKEPGGVVLRYLLPFYDDDGDLLGGLSIETPMTAVDASVKALQRKTAFQVVGLSAAAVLFIALVLMPVFSHFVVKPINTVRGELEALSRGDADLTFQIQVHSHDEIGDMGHWFNAFLSRIRVMVMRITEHSRQLSAQVQTLSHSTDEVSAMSGDVTTTVQQIARGAEEQAVKIAEVNQLMQEVQENMKGVEQTAREASKAVDRATQTARVGGKMARDTIGKMVQLSEDILHNSEMVGKLGLKSKEVVRVVELISGIAEQTNLLSLNAAIEAARAGEQGRGFSVVADEIRVLADGSSKAVQEITSMVSEMQDETAGVVASMEKSAREAQGGKEGIRSLETALDEIVAVIDGVVAHTRSITETVNAQAQRYTKILHSIQDINAVSEESAASTEEVSASTQEQSASMEQVSATCRELADMSVELKKMVEKFKTK